MVIGAAMPKPSVMLCNPNPKTSTSAKAIAPVAADCPMANPSERLCRPRPVAIIIARVRGEGAGAFFTRPKSRALTKINASKPTTRPAAKTSTRGTTLRSPRCRAASAVSTGADAWLRMSQSRKIRTPVATAFRKPWTGREIPRRRPTGRPMKIVMPATRPRMTTVAWLTL